MGERFIKEEGIRKSEKHDLGEEERMQNIHINDKSDKEADKDQLQIDMIDMKITDNEARKVVKEDSEKND